MHKMKKNLGQHFLEDQEILADIVNASSASENSMVWEIGPGSGNLTDHLLKKGIKPTCFEVDKDLWPLLEKKYGDSIQLIQKDILKVNWLDYLKDSSVHIIANLPYQITSPFLFKVVDYVDHFQELIIMIQKEVADRICSKRGTKDYGILSLKMQYFFNTAILFNVAPDKFNPPPKVDSSVIRLTPRKEKPEISDLKLFWNIIEIAFRNRRKMLRNNLKALPYTIEFKEIEKNTPIDFNRRGETLNEEEFIILYHYLRQYITR